MEKSGKQVPPSSSAQSLLDSTLGEPSFSNAPSTSAENGVERSQSQNLFTNQTPSLFMRFMNLGISGEQLPESSQSHSNEEAQNAIDVNGADEEVEQKDVERQDEVDRMSDDGYPLVMDLGHSERQSRMAKQRLIEQVIQEQGQAFEQDVMEELENANSRRVFDPIEEGEGSSTQRPANALNHDGMAFTPRVEAAIAHYMVRKYADGGNAARSPDAFGSVAVDGISVEPPPPPPPEDEPSSSSMDAPPVNILPASRNLPMSNFIAIGRRPFRTNKNRRPVANSRGDSSSLGWQATKPSLKDRLGYMFCNEVLADVYFIVGKDEQRQRIPAHKFVLSIGSVVFDAMFNGGLTPSNSRDPLEIELPDVEPPAFLTLLRFLYSDEVNIGPESVMTTLYTEAVVQTCILNNDAARQMAWQTIGTWGMELIIATNLTLSAVRFTTIMWGQKIAQRVAIFGLTLSVVWTVTFTFLQHFGIVKRIWYDGDSNYQEEHFFPFNIIRLPLFFAEIFLTLLLYLASLLRLKTIGRNAMSSTVKSREIRFLAQSIIIFVNELIFLYATYWFGYNYLGIGDSIFNANLNYWARPLTTGCTPFLYLAFSSAVRNAVKTSFPFNLCGENTKIVQIGTNSNNRRATVSSYSSMNASPH